MGSNLKPPVGPLYYVATPYSKYRDQNQAFIIASKAAAALLRRGHNVFSPIAHSHPIAHFGLIDKLDGKYWQAVCRAFMERCDGLIVICAPGWQESVGVAAEIKFFTERHRPVIYQDWPIEPDPPQEPKGNAERNVAPLPPGQSNVVRISDFHAAVGNAAMGNDADHNET